MRRSIAFAALLLAPALLFAADTVPVGITTDYGYSELKVDFDRPMLTWNAAQAASLLKLTPEVPCRWRWNDDTQLQCTGLDGGFGSPFREATVYRLDIAPGLFTQAGDALPASTHSFVVDAPRLEINPESWDAGLPRVVVESEQPLPADAIIEVLDVRFDGQPLPYRLVAEPLDEDSHVDFRDPDAVRYRLEPNAWPTTPGTLRITTRAGLRSPLGDARGVDGEKVLEWEINEPFALVEWDCGDINAWERSKDGNCAPEETIELRFTRPIDPESLPLLAAALSDGLALSEDPSACVRGCWERDGVRLHAISLESDATERDFVLTLPVDLRSTDGSVLGETPPIAIRMLPRRTAYRVDPDVVVALPGDATATPLEARNAQAGLVWVEVQVDDGARVVDRRLRPARERNVYAPLATPAPGRGLRTHGGLAIGGIEGRYDTGRATAVAAFQLLASVSDGRVIAWATTWAGALPIEGAEVEIVDIDEQGRETLRAQGRTDADGVADVALGDPATGTALSVVRATSPDGRVVVPLGNGADLVSEERSRPDGSEEWWQDADAPQFGVSERLMYRPGETVKFRLWPRTRAGNRLLPPAPGQVLTLVLQSMSTDAVQFDWDAVLDAFGSIAGTVTLPETLVDADYCIVASGRDALDNGEEGACFRVGRFQEQALWTALATDAEVRRGGERLQLDVAGGYYSGGSAAGARLLIDALVTPIDFDAAYPAWAEFEFIESYAGTGIENDPLAGAVIPGRLDADGEASIAYALPAAMLAEEELGEVRPAMPLAMMKFNARIRVDGSTDSTSPTAKVLFAQYARYVGLRSAQWWFAADADPRLEAVVVDHRGVAVDDAVVNVRIEKPREDAAPEVLARCTLPAGVESACPFRAPAPGRYTIVAEAGEAAPTRIERWFGEHFEDEEDDAAIELTVVAAGDGVSPARLRLRQPHERAMALLVAENGTVVGHWRHEVGRDATLDIPLSAARAPGVSVRVLVRPIATSAAEGIATKTLADIVRVEIPRAAARPVAMTLGSETLAPGAELAITLRNPGSDSRQVTLAIVDDSVHQQASDLHRLLDPAGDTFLGVLDRWRTAGWLDLLAWDRAYNPFSRLRLKRAEIESAAPVAAPPASYGEYGGEDLDMIQVTGSRISRADIFYDVVAHDVLPRGSREEGQPMARLRSHFPDAAYWNPGVVLAAGEETTLRVKMPDNLTRWRVLAWSSDAGDDFAMDQQTVATTLPVELRLGLPGRLFEDDASAATVTARAASGGAVDMHMQVAATGAGVDTAIAGNGWVGAQAVLARSLPLAPSATGDIAIVARAGSSAGRDAIGAQVPVHSRFARHTLPQAGWLESTVKLPLPPLPEGAIDPSLTLAVARGGGAWREAWIGALRDYPHRCWEQTLSRGLGAALALVDESGREAWPDAAAVAKAALDAAAGFQDEAGGYHYFEPERWSERASPPALDAWTLRAYGLMDRTGTPVPARLREPLRDVVDDWVEEQADLDDDQIAAGERVDEAVAVAAAALAAGGTPVDDEVLAGPWSRWQDLSWYARSELVRALAGSPTQSALALEGIARLREAGESRGLRRVIADPRDFLWAMGSSLRDQCAVVATLWDLDTDPAFAGRRRELLRGVQDLYAGGTESLDTQASVHCLVAMHAVAAREGPGADATVDVVLGTLRSHLALARGTDAATWRAESAQGELQLTPAGGDATLNYVAEMQYSQDLREARPTAVGMELRREYAVLRDGRWQPIASDAVHAGDWVRVTLRIDVPAMRHFVAITDTVPGGWSTRDITLAGVGGASLKAVADPGSWWFDTRQTGAAQVRLYAQQLPPGTHEVHYFAQATQPGEYFAPPAIAELMYGRASRSTTAPDTVRIAPAR